MSEPVCFNVDPPGARDRWGALLRPILAIPHTILVGGPLLGVRGGHGTGALGLLAITIAIFDWVAILFTGRPVRGLQQFKRLYLSWRARVLAYTCLLRDEYPPFGEGPYPASLDLPEDPETRNFTAVALRPFLVLPHLLLVFVLLVVELFVCIASWVLIVFTGRLNDSLWRFSRDVVGYELRVEAYALLIHDAFPPFAVFSDAEKPALTEPT
jgi:hypothetical protein